MFLSCQAVHRLTSYLMITPRITETSTYLRDEAQIIESQGRTLVTVAMLTAPFLGHCDRLLYPAKGLLFLLCLISRFQWRLGLL